MAYTIYIIMSACLLVYVSVSLSSFQKQVDVDLQYKNAFRFIKLKNIIKKTEKYYKYVVVGFIRHKDVNK